MNFIKKKLALRSFFLPPLQITAGAGPNFFQLDPASIAGETL
jgi:hypothetical protein